MSKEKNIGILNEDFRRSLTHERPEPQNNPPTGRQAAAGTQQNSNQSRGEQKVENRK